MKKLIPRLAGLLLISGGARPAWACPGCRAQVNSGVLGPDFAAILLVMLLPLVLLLLVGVGLYHADEIKARLRGGTV